ncbi:single-stranded DNA-binding protein [bacterium]|nr:single-stranded DNA-binding protein [bacterium]
MTGHVGSDAEVKVTPQGTSVTSFNVAMTSGWADNKKTTWLRCTMWGERGTKVAPYILKGGLVGITGEFSTREWDKAGVTQTSCEVNVQDVTLLGSPDRAKYDKAPAQAAAPAAAPVPSGGGGSFDDDIPFAPFMKGEW